jgi:glutathione S-transferase
MGEKARAYAFRLLTLDSMLAWYKSALREDFRDPPHEIEQAQYGTVTEDHRAPEKV